MTEIAGVKVLEEWPCDWAYRSAECGYSGPPLSTDTQGNPCDKDRCDKTLADCKRRFADSDALPFGGFPRSTDFG